MIVDWNEKLTDAASAALNPVGPPYCTSIGLYETFRTYGGAISCLESHMERLRRGCGMLDLKPASDTGHWASRIESVLGKNNLTSTDARIRIVVFGGTNTTCQTGVFAWPIDQPALDKRRAQGVRLITSATRRTPGDPQFQIKSLSLLPNYLAKIAAEKAGADDAVILNSRDEVCEALHANLVLVTKSGKLATPPTESPCLAGTTVGTVLAIAKDHGLPWETRPITKEELVDAAEILLCSSVSEIVPATLLDEKAVNDGTPGPMGRLLQQKYREFVTSSLVDKQRPSKDR